MPLHTIRMANIKKTSHNNTKFHERGEYKHPRSLTDTNKYELKETDVETYYNPIFYKES